jgi:hypothetical protein
MLRFFVIDSKSLGVGAIRQGRFPGDAFNGHEERRNFLREGDKQKESITESEEDRGVVKMSVWGHGPTKHNVRGVGFERGRFAPKVVLKG